MWQFETTVKKKENMSLMIKEEVCLINESNCEGWIAQLV
jgi:hypothetical protein